MTDIVVIWWMEDDVDTLHIKRMDCSGSHKYRYRWWVVVRHRNHIYLYSYDPLSHLLYLYKDDPLRVIETYSLHMQCVHIVILPPNHFSSPSSVVSGAASSVHRPLTTSTPLAHRILFKSHDRYRVTSDALINQWLVASPPPPHQPTCLLHCWSIETVS
jgi:hypothetical protein